MDLLELTDCVGRNVIIEQSYGGPKITKGASDGILLFSGEAD